LHESRTGYPSNRLTTLFNHENGNKSLKHIATHFKLSVHLIMLLAISSVAGCLVNEADVPEIKNRSTDSFRILSAGDFYDYIVDGQVTNSSGTRFIPGTLSITYNTSTLTYPFGSTTVIPGVLREETELTLGGASYRLTRFIQQDANGSIYVLATRDQASPTLYRTKYRATAASIPEPVQILDSNDPISSGIPLSGTTDIDYEYMPNCEAASPCSIPIQRISNRHVDDPTLLPPTTTYQGNADVTTNVGRYQSIRIDYTGRFSTLISSILFDIRGACDKDYASFFSSDYIFPEVGVVYIEHSCTDVSGYGHHYTASLYNTNVPIP